MNKAQKQPESITEIKRSNVTFRNTIIALLVLSLALIIGSSGSASSSNDSLSARGILWGIVSIVGLLVLLWSIFVSYRQADERQQLIQLKATSLSFMAVTASMFVSQMIYATWSSVSLNAMLQIIFIGSVLLWALLQKVFESRSQ